MSKPRTGGDFLLRPIGINSIFAKRDFNDHEWEMSGEIIDIIQKLFKKKFPDDKPEILEKIKGPNLDLLKKECQSENFDYRKIKTAFHRPNIEQIVEFLKKIGELGIFAVDVPSKYAGDVGLYDEEEENLPDRNPQARFKNLVTEVLATCPGSESVIVAVICNRGIGTLPFLLYGTEEQKKKYLPKLASGEYLGAYALTEAGSGSDALSAKTTAVLSDDGAHYILNGEKMFITNAGFADTFIVFAQLDGKFTAFIVEKDYKGLSTGLDEDKMGIHTSSTRALILENVKVPIENIIGGIKGIGKGIEIALVTLTEGRKSLGAACLGSAVKCINEIIKYTNTREQFGVPVNFFEAIKRKIAECVTETYLLDSALYRINGLIDEHINKIPLDDPNYYKKVTTILKNFTIEGCILKVFGSEILGIVTNHGVRCAGGYGYVHEYPFAQMYEDQKINELFEGTNEINCLVETQFLFTGILTEQIAVREALPRIKRLIKGEEKPFTKVHESLVPEAQAVEYAKALFLYTIDKIFCKHSMKDIKSRQQIMENLARVAGHIYLMESAILNTSQGIEANDPESDIQLLMTQNAVADLCDKIYKPCREILLGITDEQCEIDRQKMINELSILQNHISLMTNEITLRNQISDHYCTKGKFEL